MTASPATGKDAPFRLLIVTDAWRPQINGVVRTYEHIAQEMRRLGHEVAFLTPNSFYSIPCPTYPEIRLALVTPGDVRREVERFVPDYVHIATEGPLGIAARAYCRRAGHRFTTSYHTRFPEYVAARFPIPLSWLYAFERWFHNGSAGMMVSTPALVEELCAHGFNNVLLWSRGVDTEQFRPRAIRLFGADEPVFLYVGRVAVEKNIEAFLRLDLPGKKVVVGAGPQLDALKRAYPGAIFTGPKSAEALGECYASADVFVFPSLTDTYGVVLLEALASGVPVAAFPVSGPRDVITSDKVGVLDEDLGRAARVALKLNREECRRFAMDFSWAHATQQFIANVHAADNGVKLPHIDRSEQEAAP